jgi:hypothetical protein
MMMFHLMMTIHLVMVLFHFMTSHHFMTGLVVKLGGYSTLGLGYTGEQQAGGNEYRKFRVHDLCFLIVGNKSFLYIRTQQGLSVYFGYVIPMLKAPRLM